MKIFIYCCLILSFCLLSQYTHAQEVEMIDVVHLRNGSIVKGKMVTFIPGDILVLETEAGKQLTYSVEEVGRVVQARKGENVDKYQYNEKEKSPLHLPKENGWYNIIHVGLLNGQTENDIHIGISVNNTTGYLFQRWLGVGIGFGLDNYVPGAGEIVYPIFMEVRGFLQAQPNSFFYSLQGGYGFAFANSDFLVTDATGGIMYQPAVGYRIATRDALQIELKIGARFQEASFERQDRIRGGEELLTLKYQRIVMGVGISF